jgi:hypothetical protein
MARPDTPLRCSAPIVQQYVRHGLMVEKTQCFIPTKGFKSANSRMPSTKGPFHLWPTGLQPMFCINRNYVQIVIFLKSSSKADQGYSAIRPEKGKRASNLSQTIWIRNLQHWSQLAGTVPVTPRIRLTGRLTKETCTSQLSAS